MKPLPIILAGCLALCLACAGGGNSTPPAPAPPVVQQDATGIWMGTVTSTVAGESFQATAIMTPSGGFYYRASNGVAASAVIPIIGDSGTGVGTQLYRGVLTPMQINVTKLTTKGTATGTYSAGTDKGTFNFTFNAAYTNTTPDWQGVAGEYDSYNSGTTIKTYLLMDTSGGFVQPNGPGANWFTTELVVRSGKMVSTSAPGIIAVDLVLARSDSEAGVPAKGYGYYNGKMFFYFMEVNGSLWVGWMLKPA